MNKRKDDVNISESNKSISFTKPASSILQIASKEQIKVMELVEFCQLAETDLKSLTNKIEFLTYTNHESSKLRDSFITRNRIDVTNTESLILARNELYSYKCELKSKYLAAEESIKCKRLRYKNIISSYESEWQKASEEYNSNPLVAEFIKIQRDNNHLEEDIKKLEKLFGITKNQISGFIQNIENEFEKKVVEFAKEMISYRAFIDFKKAERERKVLLEQQQQSLGSKQFRLLVQNATPHDFDNLLKSINQEVKDSAMDVSHFDQISIPSENLEKYNDEELLPFYPKPLTTDQKDNPSEYEEMSFEIDQNVESPAKSSEKRYGNTKVYPQEQGEGDGIVENESQYFQSGANRQEEHPDVWRKSTRDEMEEEGEKNAAKKLKTSHEARPAEELADATIACGKGFAAEDKEDLSEDGSEKQCGYPVQGNYDVEDYNNSSASSEASVAMSAGSANDFRSFAQQPLVVQNSERTSVEEKDTFKSFGGFFSMSDTQNSPKPSIFKLF